MTPEQNQAMKDAHTRVSQLPGYTGSIVVIFTNDAKDVQIGSTVPDRIAREVLIAFLRSLSPPPIIVPASAGIDPRRLKNGGR